MHQALCWQHLLHRLLTWSSGQMQGRQLQSGAARRTRTVRCYLTVRRCSVPNCKLTHCVVCMRYLVMTALKRN